MAHDQSNLTSILAPLDNQKDMAKHPLPMKPCNVAIVGKAGCGKSSLILNLITKKGSPWYKHFDLIFLVSPTARGDPKFSNLLEDLEDQDQYYDTLDNDVLQDIIDKMDAYTEEREKKRSGKKKRDPAYLIIYDDVIHLLKGKKSRLVDMLVTQNRHRKLTNVFLLQKWNTYMSPLIRSNLGCIAMFYTGNEKELSSFIEEMSDNEKKVRKLYEYATLEPYSFLWVNQYGARPVYYKKFDEIIVRKKISDQSKDDAKAEC
jgi:hypothetical protein